MATLDGKYYPQENLSVRNVDHVRILQIEREDKLGAFSTPLVEALGAEIRAVRQDEFVRVLMITGTGRGFVAGADIGEYSSASRADFEEYQRRSRTVFDDLARLPQPTIAAVNGYAFGGGFEFALCCDFIVASSAARFGLPEIKLGLFPGGGGPQRLSREAGARWTKELVMTGRTVYPNEAMDRGILTKITAPDDLYDEALGLATELASRPRAAVREAKHLVDAGRSQDLDTALTADQIALGRLFDSPDGREGVLAFIEKRDPHFDPR
ncbi:enoyl-CoA hydratase/isomerase family protein [Microbacterium marinum]|uniref:enoyl-CoA hydratase/isomerase family protein n=1 Tax=Microbacterium marinum TaxID=421115 RepID=UPI003850D7F0